MTPVDRREKGGHRKRKKEHRGREESVRREEKVQSRGTTTELAYFAGLVIKDLSMPIGGGA